MPTARRMLSGVASALFMARRIQAGLAANNSPSSTNRIPRPMRKSANAMDLIGLKPPASCFFYWYLRRSDVGSARHLGLVLAEAPGRFLGRFLGRGSAYGGAYGFGAAAAAAGCAGAA